MKVKFIGFLEDEVPSVDLTVGKVYEVLEVSEVGVIISDDIQFCNGLFNGEFEVVEE